VAEGKATVEVSIQVDAAALRTYLEESLGLSLSREQEGKFRVFVLAYTVEGMDPSRTQPNVLREEVEDNKKNVQHDKKSNSSASSSSSSKAESLAVDASVKDKGSVDASQSASLAASGSRGTSVSGEGFSGKDSATGKVDAKESGSASAKWDQEAKLKADASTASSSASAKRQSSSSDNFSDTSTFYRRLVIYEDTSKKGAGSTNEVRAKLGELLKSQGLTTGFLDVRLMGRQFQNEDEIYAAILQELEKRPEVGADDYVAVALNRLTPIKAEKPRFSAQVTYRVVRVGDRGLLLPDKVVASESGEQISEDIARTVATEGALLKSASVLEAEMSRALKELERRSQRKETAQATAYEIRVDNVANPAATRSIKAALREAGFVPNAVFRGNVKSESLSVPLQGKRGDEVQAVLEPLLGPYEVLLMDQSGCVLKARWEASSSWSSRWSGFRLRGVSWPTMRSSSCRPRPTCWIPSLPRPWIPRTLRRRSGRRRRSGSPARRKSWSRAIASCRTNPSRSSFRC
jgi:hypothetical protein